MIKFKIAKSKGYEEAVQLSEKYQLKEISSMRYDIMIDDTKIGYAFHGNRGTIYIAEMLNGEVFKASTKKELMAILEGK